MAVVLALCCICTATSSFAQDPHCFTSCPAGLDVQRLQNPGFSIGYDPALGQARWVAYRASPLPKRKKPRYRSGRFGPDPRLGEGVSHWDYLGSGFDRGHLAPAFLLGALYGSKAAQASYWLSNISPQKPRLNRLLMQRLEEAEAHKIARTPGGVWVLAGPVFAKQPARTARGIAIPQAFFRVWLDVREHGQLSACAFLLPQDVDGLEPLDQFTSSVDAIEAATGLDLFSTLPIATQQALEHRLPDAEWPLAEIADWPARYKIEFDAPRP